MQANSRNAIIAILAALLLFVIWRAQLPAEGDAAKPVAKEAAWEYKIQSTNEGLLNSLGREGWEVCAAYTKDTNVAYVILKRAKVK